MAEREEPRPEGWRVATKPAVGLAAGALGLIAAILAVMGGFYSASTQNPHASIAHSMPAPQLRTDQRHPDAHLPEQAYGPPKPNPGQQLAIDQAMRTLAGRGDAGWAPLAAPAPVQTPPVQTPPDRASPNQASPNQASPNGGSPNQASGP